MVWPLEVKCKHNLSPSGEFWQSGESINIICYIERFIKGERRNVFAFGRID